MAIVLRVSQGCRAVRADSRDMQIMRVPRAQQSLRGQGSADGTAVGSVLLSWPYSQQGVDRRSVAAALRKNNHN